MRKNPEDTKEYHRKWVENNREKQREYVRKWRIENPEKMKAIREADKYKKYPSNSPEAKKIYNTLYNQTRRKKSVYKFSDNNAHWCRIKSYRRRGALGNHTKKQWEEIKEIQDYKCAYCSKKEPDIKLTVDHIIAIYNGGTNDIYNIQAVCRNCNSSKGTKLAPVKKLV